MNCFIWNLIWLDSASAQKAVVSHLCLAPNEVERIDIGLTLSVRLSVDGIVSAM